MKRIIYFISILIVVVFIKCKKYNECNVDEPITELSWLEELKQQIDDSCFHCEVSILQAEYRSQTVFYTSITDPLCNSIFSVDLLNCNGKVIRHFSSEDREKFYNKVTNSKKLYSCTPK